MNVQPLHDRIIVHRLAEGEQQSGGIIIPDTAKEKPQQGTVMAAGHGKAKDGAGRFGRCLRILACTAFLFACASTVEAVNVTAMWDTSTDPSVTGYLLSYGTQSGTYSTFIDVGNATSRQISLSSGQRYYFAVQAYNTDLVYSPYSAEVMTDLTVTAPSLTSLNPSSGAVGTPVTIAGANFGATQGTSTITFNGTAATPTSWNGTSISVPVPSTATTGPVVVTVGGLASNAVAFTVGTPPSITSRAPTSGPVATSVTITGINFGATKGTSTVTFNGTTGTPTTWAATSIVVPVPAGATTGNVVVTVGGLASNAVAFAVTLPAPWTAQDVGSPALAGSATAASGTFSITGAGVDIWDQRRVPLRVPAPRRGRRDRGPRRQPGEHECLGEGGRDDPRRPDGRRAQRPGLRERGHGPDLPAARQPRRPEYEYEQRGRRRGRPVLGPRGPQREYVQRLFVGHGHRVDLAGQHHRADDGTGLRRPGGDEPDPTVVTTGTFSNVTVTTTTTTPPSLTSLAPTSGAVGASVTVTGTNFGATKGTSTVTFNGTTATPTTWSATSIVVPVPAGATTGNVVVTVGGVASNGVAFTVLPTPSVTSLAPTSGAVGASVTITGTNFGATQGTSTVTFNGTAATPTTWSATSIVVPVPAGATTGNVVVTVGGLASNGVAFTVGTPPSVTSLAPTSGPVGASVTITGTNFGATKGTSTVTFNGTTGTPTTWAATSIVVPVPAGATTGNVVVTVGGLASNAVAFAVTLPAPWTAQDVGSPALAGSATATSGTFSVTGAGVDIWDSSDEFRFVYQPLDGDGEIVARVDSLLNTNDWAKAGVMIREDLTGGAPNAMAYVSAGVGMIFQRRISRDGPSTSTGGGVFAGAAPYWVRLVRSGDTFSGYTSATGTAWILMGSMTVPMTAQAYVGLAVTSHDPSVVTTGTFSNVTVTTTTTTPPSITSRAPTSGPVATPVTITGTNFGATKGTSTISFNGTTATPTTWAATSIVVPVPAGATTGNVVVTVGGVASNGMSFTVNRPPTLAAVANQTSAENATVSLQLVASDPDGDALTYSATGLPPSLTVNAATGLISGTVAPASAGVYSVTATASDASLATSQTFTWTVTPLSGTINIDLAPQDTYASLDSVNYATAATLNTYTWPANQVANAILMKFGLSQIPATATIQSATLYLNLVQVDSYTAEPAYTVALHEIINHNPDLTSATGSTYDGVHAWTANACCYSNVPLAQADISAARSTTAVDRTLGFKTWDATSTVQEWLTTPRPTSVSC